MFSPSKKSETVTIGTPSDPNTIAFGFNSVNGNDGAPGQTGSYATEDEATYGPGHNQSEGAHNGVYPFNDSEFDGGIRYCPGGGGGGLRRKVNWEDIPKEYYPGGSRGKTGGGLGSSGWASDGGSATDNSGGGGGGGEGEGASGGSGGTGIVIIRSHNKK